MNVLRFPVDTATNLHWRRSLINARQRKFMTQTDVAQRLKVHQKTFSDWERGKRIPDFETLNRWAALLGLNQIINPAPEA